ncbi:UNVERIFIED_CONTAM: hypothetical protein FKN15_051482 [Acipenser sinensis]
MGRKSCRKQRKQQQQQQQQLQHSSCMPGWEEDSHNGAGCPYTRAQGKEQLSPQASVATPLPPLPPGSPPSREIWDWLVHPEGNFASDLPWGRSPCRLRSQKGRSPCRLRIQKGRSPCRLRSKKGRSPCCLRQEQSSRSCLCLHHHLTKRSRSYPASTTRGRGAGAASAFTTGWTRAGCCRISAAAA